MACGWRGDALKMAAGGMRIVRTHYMMPGWMRTVPWQIYAPAIPGIYDQFELGPEISERHLRAIEAHVMIFNSLGILFQPTVFTLPPPQMGSPNAFGETTPGWPLAGASSRTKSDSPSRWSNGSAAIPGVVWDLVNEAE